MLAVGNEGEAYAPSAGLPGLEIALAQSMSLMGQDRSRKPDLTAVLRAAGLRRGQTIGLVGWKYFEPAGMGRAFAWLVRSPLFRLDARDSIAGGTEAIDGRDGRADASDDGAAFDDRRRPDRIARMGRCARFGRRVAHRDRDTARRKRMEAVSAMGYAGEVLTAHVMYATGDASHAVVGLRSPGGRIVSRGDGVGGRGRLLGRPFRPGWIIAEMTRRS